MSSPAGFGAELLPPQGFHYFQLTMASLDNIILLFVNHKKNKIKILIPFNVKSIIVYFVMLYDVLVYDTKFTIDRRGGNSTLSGKLPPKRCIDKTLVSKIVGSWQRSEFFKDPPTSTADRVVCCAAQSENDVSELSTGTSASSAQPYNTIMFLYIGLYLSVCL